MHSAILPCLYHFRICLRTGEYLRSSSSSMKQFQSRQTVIIKVSRSFDFTTMFGHPVSCASPVKTSPNLRAALNMPSLAGRREAFLIVSKPGWYQAAHFYQASRKYHQPLTIPSHPSSPLKNQHKASDSNKVYKHPQTQ